MELNVLYLFALSHFRTGKPVSTFPENALKHVAFRWRSGIDIHGALTICLHAGGNPASVKSGFGLPGGGCSVDSLNQKSSSLPQPSLARGGAGGLHSALSAGQAICT
jgi:hypothetical protein